MPDKKKASDKAADKKKSTDKGADKKKTAEKPAKTAEKKPKEEKPADAPAWNPTPPVNNNNTNPSNTPVNNNNNNTPPAVLDSSHPRIQEYLQKVQHLHYKVNTLLIPKRDLLLNQLYANQYKKKEIQTSKSKVIHETQFYLQKIISKLDEQERNFSAPLNQKITELEKSLSLIQDFLAKISKLSSLPSISSTSTTNPFDTPSMFTSPFTPPSQLTHNANLNQTPNNNNPTMPAYHAATSADIDMFLQFYNDYLSECEFLSANFALQEQSNSNSIGMYGNSSATVEFERKVSQFDMLERVNEELKRGMEWKDQMIKSLIQERDAIKLQKEQEVEALKKLYQKTKEELMKWIHLYDNNSYLAK